MNNKQTINQLLNDWHLAAANAQLEKYIGVMDSSSIYIGTEATENWSRDSFYAFCKPYFDKGTTWDFKTLERNIYLDSIGTVAWFDELLKTQMGVCRGSGILIKINDDWKIKHYVLSMAIPNDVSKEVTTIKKKWDELFIEKSKEIN